jgi:acyl-CoA synthetase (AMP-forming)/AMP-acid ligase II
MSSPRWRAGQRRGRKIYWGLPEENAFTFRDGWHHTGDLGRFDEDGYLWYADRKAEKELIKPGGENVYPAEVEKAILAHPNVEKTVVFERSPLWVSKNTKKTPSQR